MIVGRLLPTKVQARDLRAGDVIVTAGDMLDAVVEVEDYSVDSVRVGYYRTRMSSDVTDFAGHDDPAAQRWIRPDAWIRIVRLVLEVTL